MADNKSSDDDERRLCLTQIEYLDEQLERSQLKCVELEGLIKDLASQCSELKREENDLADSLKRAEAEHEREVDGLLEQMRSEQRAAEEDRDALSLQHDLQVQKLQQQMDALASLCRAHAEKILEQKEQMEDLQRMESLQKQLASQKEEHRAGIHNLKRQTAMHTVKVIRAMNDLLKIRVRHTLQKERDQRGKLGERLLFLLNESMRLQEVNDAVQDRNRALGAQRDDLQRDLKAAKQESVAYRKQVQQLSGNCSELNAELKSCSVARQHIVANTEELRKQRDQILKVCEKMDETDELEAELQRERSRQRQLEGAMQDATIVLTNILSESDTSDETRWKVQRLLEILDTVACQ